MGASRTGRGRHAMIRISIGYLKKYCVSPILPANDERTAVSRFRTDKTYPLIDHAEPGA